MKSKTLAQEKKETVQDICAVLSGNIFTKNCKCPSKKEKEEVFELLKKARLLFGTEIPYSDEMKENFFNGKFIEKVKIADFLKEYSETECVYLCSVTGFLHDFAFFWNDKVGKKAIKEKADLFIEEICGKDNSSEKYLFCTDTYYTPKQLRIKFLSWCLQKNYNYLDELFTE